MNIGHPAQNNQKQKIATSYNMIKGSFWQIKGCLEEAPNKNKMDCNYIFT